MTEKHNQSLLPYNTFGMEAFTELLVEYNSPQELKDWLLKRNNSTPQIPLLHVGRGSNLLFTKNFQGVVLHSGIQSIQVECQTEQQLLVKVGAGMVWDHFVEHCVNQGWYGVENLSAIPGEVGASAVQNIGAYGVEAKDVIHQVELMDLQTAQVITVSNAQCKYGYRQSIFKNEWKGRFAVLYVTFKLQKTFQPKLSYGMLAQRMEGKPLTAAELRNTIIQVRNEKLPDYHVEGNAGSYFMNPVIEKTHYEQLLVHYPTMPHYDVDAQHVKVPAAWLIDQCGWKGKSMGHAGVNARQPLVLVNRGGASPQEVIDLANAVIQSVDEKFNIHLHPEVIYV